MLSSLRVELIPAVGDTSVVRFERYEGSIGVSVRVGESSILFRTESEFLTWLEHVRESFDLAKITSANQRAGAA